MVCVALSKKCVCFCVRKRNTLRGEDSRESGRSIGLCMRIPCRVPERAGSNVAHFLYPTHMERKFFLLWHPHQKLWHWDLAARLATLPMGSLLGRGLIHADSMILALHVVGRRLRKLGLRSFRGLQSDPVRPVLYVDCGVHKEGQQIRLMSEWFGSKVALRILAFEASPRHYPDAARNLADIQNLDLCHAALVGPRWRAPTIRLYRTGGNGKGDSIYPERGNEYDEVSVVRLSKLLPAEGTILLRMNIEGAELGVIEDLVAAGMQHRIDGFYGMWDDLSKIDWQRDLAFRQLLRKHRVKTTTFNDRDLAHPLRRWAIRLDIDTALQARLP